MNCSPPAGRTCFETPCQVDFAQSPDLRYTCHVLRANSQLRAAVRLMIEDMLDAQLPDRYDSDLYHQKCADVYAHVYDSYAGAGQSIYAAG